MNGLNKVFSNLRTIIVAFQPTGRTYRILKQEVNNRLKANLVISRSAVPSEGIEIIPFLDQGAFGFSQLIKCNII